MAKQAVASHSVDFEPIDRLEEKITRLVTIVAQLRTEQARALDENARLSQENDALRAQLTEADTLTAELATLKDERDVIRTRVADMLQQLDAIQ